MYFYYNTGTWRSNILRKWFNWANIIRTGSSLCVQCRDMTIAWLKDCIQKSCRPRNQKAVSLLTRFCRQTRAQTRKPLQKLAVRLFTVSAPGDDIYKVSGRRVQGSRGEGEKVQKHTPLSQQTLFKYYMLWLFTFLLSFYWSEFRKNDVLTSSSLAESGQHLWGFFLFVFLDKM